MTTFQLPLLYTAFLAFFSSVYVSSLPNDLFYLFNRDFDFSANPLYHQYCLGFPRSDISCFILKNDIFNYLINRRTSYLVFLENRRADSCYHLPYISSNFASPLFTPDLIPPTIVLFPFVKSSQNNLVSSLPDRLASLLSGSSPSFINFDDKVDFGACVFIISEVCRVNDLFSSSISKIVSGSALKILSISGKRTSFPDKINYDISSDVDSFVPSLDYFNDFILTTVTDQFYIYKNEMLKRLEYTLRNRECVLLNEMDLLFLDITHFPLETYQEIEKFRVSLMDGFNHFTYVAYKKLQAYLRHFSVIWSDIEKSELGTALNLIEKFINLYISYENDLNHPLKLIMDESDYRDILEISSTYFAYYSKQMELKKNLSRSDINKLLGVSNNILSRLSILLYKQCQIPSVFGPVATSAYFKALDDKIAKI